MLASEPPKPLIIDCDPGLGVPWADVDDSLAIFLALASSEVELLGVTVTFGNVDLPTGMQVAAETLAVANAAGLPLFAGAANNHRPYADNAAVDWLLATVNQRPGEITLLALGPLTNIAAAMQRDSEFLHKLGGLVILGGALKFPYFGWRGEHNFRHDPVAVNEVLSSAVAKTLITMDTCRSAQFTEAHRQRFSELDTPLGNYIADGVGHWLNIHRRYLRLKGFYPWDVVGLAQIISPELFEVETARLAVRESGIRRGAIRYANSGGAVELATSVNGEAFMRLFIDRLVNFAT